MNKILDEAFTRNVEVLKSAQWSRDGSVLSHKISHFIQKYERAEKAHRKFQLKEISICGQGQLCN